ncbi:MAG: ABC transporter permease, partial [Myxococcota bacterium]
MIRRDLVRVRGALVTSGFGIAAGTAALVFFLALGMGVRDVLLGEVFPIDQVELEPPKGGGGLGQMAAFAFGMKAKAPRISQEQVEELRKSDAAAGVYPKLKMSFPSRGFGGKELLGKNIGSTEMIADGIDPELVEKDVTGKYAFVDPLKACARSKETTPSTKEVKAQAGSVPHCGTCSDTKQCASPQYCEGPVGGNGVCVEPVPVVISRFLIEIFDKSIAPTHGYPQIGEELLQRAEGMTGYLWLGDSVLGKSKLGKPRQVHIRLVGISSLAVDLGMTMPIDTVRRFNREYAGEDAASAYSSVLVRAASTERVADVVALGESMELTPKDTNARDISVLLTGVMSLLALVAAIILIVSASNIAYTFRVLVNDRRREIALYRAIGASAADMVKWLLGLALTVGSLGGAVGVGLAFLLSLVADRLAAQKLPDFPFKP